MPNQAPPARLAVPIEPVREKPHAKGEKLRKAEVVLAQGGTVADACRRIGVTEKSSYPWRMVYSGLNMDQGRRMKDLDNENACLRRMVSDQTLDKLIATPVRKTMGRISLMSAVHP